jgi:hypothetical protein
VIQLAHLPCRSSEDQELNSGGVPCGRPPRPPHQVGIRPMRLSTPLPARFIELVAVPAVKLVGHGGTPTRPRRVGETAFNHTQAWPKKVTGSVYVTRARNPPACLCRLAVALLSFLEGVQTLLREADLADAEPTHCMARTLVYLAEDEPGQVEGLVPRIHTCASRQS